MNNNKLWEGHRIIVPQWREKAMHTCAECRFWVQIVGRTETRSGCLVSVPKYGRLRCRVPNQISIVEALKLVGREGLDKLLLEDTLQQACGLFRPK